LIQIQLTSAHNESVVNDVLDSESREKDLLPMRSDISKWQWRGSARQGTPSPNFAQKNPSHTLNGSGSGCKSHCWDENKEKDFDLYLTTMLLSMSFTMSTTMRTTKSIPIAKPTPLPPARISSEACARRWICSFVIRSTFSSTSSAVKP
jgi:hypothetical protein